MIVENDLQKSSAKGYFVPMADLLTGLVFILIIVLTAAQITNRPEFGIDKAVETQRRQLAVELERLNALALQRVRPAERIESQLKFFLEKLKEQLSLRGVTADVDTARGLLLLEEGQLLHGAESVDRQRRPVRESASGTVVLNSVADSLYELVSCVASQTLQKPCAGMQDLKLRRIIVSVVPTTPQATAEASAAALLLTAGMIDRQPLLATIRDSLGRQLIEAHGIQLANTKSIALAFDVDRPIPPDNAWLLKDRP